LSLGGPNDSLSSPSARGYRCSLRVPEVDSPQAEPDALSAVLAPTTRNLCLSGDRRSRSRGPTEKRGRTDHVPANPSDNASCESFMKTLKREEIYANKYDDLENLRANIEEFIEQYYNRLRLHSALGYRAPEEFEQQIEASASAESRSATMVFFENKENSRKISKGLLGKGTQMPSPSPDPFSC
jgi:transposase InsO family protein